MRSDERLTPTGQFHVSFAAFVGLTQSARVYRCQPYLPLYLSLPIPECEAYDSDDEVRTHDGMDGSRLCFRLALLVLLLLLLLALTGSLSGTAE